MGRKHKNPPAAFGEHLRALRKAKGFTQSELADAVGTSQRMIAYYEAQGGNVSADVITKLADVLEVSVDEIVHGNARKTTKTKQVPQSLRLIRKLHQIETLPSKERRSVLQYIDALVERQALKRAHG